MSFKEYQKKGPAKEPGNATRKERKWNWRQDQITAMEECLAKESPKVVCNCETRSDWYNKYGIVATSNEERKKMYHEYKNKCKTYCKLKRQQNKVDNRGSN